VWTLAIARKVLLIEVVVTDIVVGVLHLA